MAKKKERELTGSGFGSFLGGTISRRLTGVPEPEPTTDLDPEAMQRALERAAAPRKIKDLQAQIDQLRKQVRGKDIGKKREAALKPFIRVVKAENPNYTQPEIAKAVDHRLGLVKKNFATVCPEGWRRYHLPVHFADVFSRPNSDPLRILVKSYISKA